MTVFRILGEVTREVVAYVEAASENEARQRFERLDVDQIESDGIVCSVIALRVTIAADGA